MIVNNDEEDDMVFLENRREKHYYGRKLRYLLPVLLSMYTSVGILLSLATTKIVETSNSNLINFVYSVLASLNRDRIYTSLIAIAVFLILYQLKKVKFNRNCSIVALIFAFAISAMQLISYSMAKENSLILLFGDFYAVFKSIWKLSALMVLFYSVFYIALIKCKDMSNSNMNVELGKFDRKSFRKIFFYICLAYIPYLFFFYPGIFYGDTLSQVKQFYGYDTVILKYTPWYDLGLEYSITNHHPAFLTFFFGFFFQIGNALGDVKLGIFLYSLMQIALVAATEALTICYLNYIGVKKKITKVITYFYMFFPPIAIWSITMLKDTLYAMMHIILTIALIEIVRSKGNLLKNIKFDIFLFFVSLFYMLDRSQGVYSIFILMIVLIIAYRKLWIRTLCIFFSGIILFKVIFVGLLLPALNVAPAGKQEMLGVFFQQTARYVKEWSSEIPEDEKKIIDRVLDYDKLEKVYQPIKQDPVKFTYKQLASTDDLINYMKVWVKQFIRHPVTYMEATLNNIYGFFNLNHSMSYAYTDVSGQYLKGLDKIKYSVSDNGFMVFGRELAEFFLKVYTAIPGLNILLTPSSFIWMTIAGFIILCMQKKKKYLVAFVPTIFGLLLLFISPVVNWRYAMPFVYSVPIIVSLIAKKEDGQTIEEKVTYENDNLVC